MFSGYYPAAQAQEGQGQCLGERLDQPLEEGLGLCRCVAHQQRLEGPRQEVEEGQQRLFAGQLQGLPQGLPQGPQRADAEFRPT